MYSPIAKTLPQYVDENGQPYSGAVLKAYAAGTSTQISFAIDEDGNTLASIITLNASGYPEVSGNEVMPFLNETYKLALYPDQDAADSNTGSIWIIDNIRLIYLDLDGEELTSIGDGTARDSAVNVGQVQDGQFTYVRTTEGSADAYTVTTSPTFEAYDTTQRFYGKIHATNATTTPYIQFNSIASPASNAVIKKLNASKSEIAVQAGDMVAGGIYCWQRNSTDTAWILMNPEYPYLRGNYVGMVGESRMWNTNTPPDGWLEENGAAISRTVYAALFAVIGTTFGVGDGSTTFNLPDSRGYFIRGWDNGRGVDSGRVFGSNQADAFQGHRHNTSLSGEAFVTDGAAAGAGPNAWINNSGPVTTGDPLTDTVNGTPRTASETRPINIAKMFIIKY